MIDPTHISISIGKVAGLGHASLATTKALSTHLERLQEQALELAGGVGPGYREGTPEAAAASALLDALDGVGQAEAELTEVIEKIESLILEPKLVQLGKAVRAL